MSASRPATPTILLACLCCRGIESCVQAILASAAPHSFERVQFHAGLLFTRKLPKRFVLGCCGRWPLVLPSETRVTRCPCRFSGIKGTQRAGIAPDVPYYTMRDEYALNCRP